MIDQIEMMRLIENLRGDAIVVPAMRANVGWSQVSNNINRDVPASGAMGKTCYRAVVTTFDSGIRQSDGYWQNKGIVKEEL